MHDFSVRTQVHRTTQKALRAKIFKYIRQHPDATKNISQNVAHGADEPANPGPFRTSAASSGV